MADARDGEQRFVARVPLDIRPCRVEDLRELEWFGRWREHRSIIAHTFERMKRGEQMMWVAVRRGFPAGQVWVDLELGRLWAARVFPPLRGCGIGGRLVRVAERDLLARGAARASVTVETTNPRALSFWLRQGYCYVRTASEPWAYVTPEGRHVVVTSELHVLEKSLEARTDAGDPLDHR